MVVLLVLSTTIAVVIHIRLRRKKRRNPDHLTYKAVVTLQMSFPEAIELAVSAVRSSGGSIVSVNRDEGIVNAKFGMTWRSWGQYLQFDVWSQEDGTCKCACRSWPSSDIQAVDWGAGKLTVEHYIEELKTNAPGVVSVVPESTHVQT